MQTAETPLRQTKQAQHNHHLNSSKINWAEMDGYQQTISPLSEQDKGRGKILGAEQEHKLAEQNVVGRKREQ